MAAPPGSGVPRNEWSHTYEEFGLFLKGVRHYAIDWRCWLVGTVNGDSLWMSLLCIASNEDLTIVIDPSIMKPNSKTTVLRTPVMKQITPGTTRAETVDTILRHIKHNQDYSIGANISDALETQIFKQGWKASEEPYMEYMPNLKALAVIWPPSDQEDDENGTNDETYLEKVRSQCRYHTLKFTLESMSFEQEDLRKQMKDDGTDFPDFSISTCGGFRYG
ncbi:hypothetical protein ONS96_004788 [Cadophora gregata f. sp. sojae]|nr:hypothetical protein ONS96_004788 [Cadophora gregata f. sp. sojae]